MPLPTNYAEEFLRLPKPDALPHWVSEFNRMALHTQQAGADKLIKKRRPNEPEDIFKYRKDNFEHITSQAIIRAVNNLQRYFAQAKATVKTNDDTRTYLKDGDFQGLDFDTFINQKVINRMIEDPNGFLVWWADGEGAKDPTKAADAKPIMVLTSEVMHYTRDYFTFKSHEKSDVEAKDGKEKTGDVYYIIDRTGYHKLVQTGKKEKKTFKLKRHYKQEFTTLPVITLGGETTTKILQGKEISYLTSYFSGFIPFANEALRQFSDHQAIMVTAGFPIREMEAMPCTECEGKGIIRTTTGRGQTKKTSKSTCKSCNGTKMRIPSTPYGILLKQTKKSSVLNGDQPEIKEAMRYISPDVNILKYAGEHWENLLEKAEKSLSLNHIDEAQSGIAKEMDRDNLMAMLERIGHNIYNNIVRNSITAIQTIRTRGQKVDVEIILPNTFKIRSETDLVNELNSLIEKDSPLPLIVEVTKELTKKRYAGNDTIIKAVNFLALYDPFFVYPLEKRLDMYGSGALTWEEYRTSLYSYNAVMQVAATIDDFQAADFKKIEKQVTAIIAPKLKVKIVPSDGGTPAE